MDIHGITIEPPAGFVAEETMVSLRQPPQSSAPTEKQVVLRPNLIVHSKRLRKPKTLSEITAEVVSDLERAMPGMADLRSRELTFSDGVVGMSLAYDHAAASVKLRQLYVFRVDDQRLTALTLTLNAAVVTPEIEASMLASLASARRSETR